MIVKPKAGMDEKTARQYLRLGRLPSQIKGPQTWRTRPDPFAEVWGEVLGFLDLDAGLEETFFPQIHEPGDLSEMDFTWMNALGVTIQKQRFDHLIFHFVLTYSNWETGTVCFSESFESLSLGLQNALWELGGVPKKIRTDQMSAAVHQECRPDEFTAHYRALLRHYGLEGAKTRVDAAHENGDVEQRHHRLKRMVDQALRLRGSRDFETRGDYEAFLRTLFGRANRGRRPRVEEELRVLSRLPERRLDDFRPYRLQVSPFSTIRVKRNTYSVESRLIGEEVTVRLYGEHLDVLYGQKLVERIPRLRGEHRHRIDYRHIIDWLVRKPGAFEHYRYRDDLYPTTRFRMAWDILAKKKPTRAVKEYLEILHLAAKESETGVDDAIRAILDAGADVSVEAIQTLLRTAAPVPLRSGKTHLVCAIGNVLVRQGRYVFFTTCSLLVQELLLAKRNLQLPRMLKKLAKYEALIIDIGYVHQGRDETDVLFTLLAERYERGSVMITSNLPFSKWETIFKDPMVMAAAIDRIVHHSVILKLNIGSYRMSAAKRTAVEAAA